MSGTKEILLRPIAGPVDRSVRLPGSKSLTNRALVAAALASGTSHIDGVLFADDTERMMEALKTLGVSLDVDRQRRRVVVQGCSGFWPNGDVDVFCGGAGTVIRFLTAACCLGQGRYRLDGDDRMRVRPIDGLVSALRDLGAAVAYEGEEGYCPLTVHGRGLRGGRVRFDRPPSSQFISALLLAAPRAGRDVYIEVAGALPSAPYVRMTLSVMEAFGVSALGERMCSFIVPAGQTYSATHYEVEPDASAASYFFAAAAITGGRITVEGLGRESVQGDWAFVDVLEQMGCRVERAPRSTTVRGPKDGLLHGVDVDLNDMPDVAQTLGVLAAFADGPTTIRNVANLRIKETDRLFALAAELGHLGVETEVGADGITIRPDKPPVPGIIDTYDDHRMAMSFALAGLRLDGVVIRDPDCCGKTFPGFFQMWAELGGVESALRRRDGIGAKVSNGGTRRPYR